MKRKVYIICSLHNSNKMANIESKLGGFMSKSKALALAAAIGLTGAAQEAYSQVILSFSGPTTVQVGVPTTYNLVINSQSTASGFDASGNTNNVASSQIASIDWKVSLSNLSNATVNSMSSPSSSDAFTSFTTTSTYSTNLLNADSRKLTTLTGPGPTNIPDLNYATITVTFNQPGSYTFSYSSGFASVVDIGGNPLGLTSSSTLGITASAVPEPSTYAAIAGGIALVGAAALRRRKNSKDLSSKVN